MAGAGVGVFKAATGAETGRTGVATGGVSGFGSVCIESTVMASRVAVETAVTGTELRALRKASAVWKRSAGSLAIAIRMISFNAGGSPGWRSTGGLGASFT